jgi:hypothetical protein
LDVGLIFSQFNCNITLLSLTNVYEAGPSFLEQKRPAESLDLTAEKKKAAELEREGGREKRGGKC